MSDAFEDQALALAHSVPVCDLGSTQGIQAIAIGLRETWRMATEAAEEKSGKVIAGLNAQLTAEIDATGRFAARNITLESKLDWVRELGMSYSRDAHEAQKQIALLEQTIQNGAEMIRAAHARAEAAEAERDRLAVELKEIGLEPIRRNGFTRVIGSEKITPPALSSTTESQT